MGAQAENGTGNGAWDRHSVGYEDGVDDGTGDKTENWVYIYGHTNFFHNNNIIEFRGPVPVSCLAPC